MYQAYKPIPAETLPAAYEGVFKRLALTAMPANDEDRILTLTGETLQLETTAGHRPVFAAGYQKAMWELREGHLRYCPSQGNLWRRDADDTDHAGDRYILNSWHPIKTIEEEYSIGTTASDHRRNYALSATILREAKRAQYFPQVERGMRFGSVVWVRRDGVVQRIDDDDLAVVQTFDVRGLDKGAVDQAYKYCQWLTNDSASCSNLIRMFATPWLEPFKQLSYVFSGHGGDGKTLLLRRVILGVLGVRKVFPGFSVAKYCGGGFSLANESMNDAMDGCAFAYDDETCTVTERMLPELRALSTGTQMQARVIGGKYRTITPTATMVYLTNQPFADSSEQSDKRRFVKVEMHPSDGRSYDEYHAIETFVAAHPAAFFFLSASLWQTSGDAPEIVNLAPSRLLSDEDYWIVNAIVANEQAGNGLIASKKAFKAEFGRSVPQQSMQLLGLKNSTSIALGSQQRVVRVANEARFNTYRLVVEEQDAHDLKAEAEQLSDRSVCQLDELIPIEPAFAPSEYGFGCDYTPARSDKSAINWKRMVADEHTDTSRIPDCAAHTVVPQRGFMVLDLDVPKDGAPDGWTRLQELVGSYATGSFPRTYLVRTPSGGVHAYYKVPPVLEGLLKNRVHADGLPIDVRADGKGYVIGAGSTTDAGVYRLIDVPDGDAVPELSAPLARFLIEHDYTTVHTNAGRVQSQQVLPAGFNRDYSPFNASGGAPDLSPIPVGERNSTLYKWACGRLLNYPDNAAQIKRDFYARGHASGLQDRELDASWRSAAQWTGVNA